jgi:PGF-CTERM protein
MNVDRTTILSLALTAIMITSVLPMGLVGTSGTAEAHHGNWYTLRQPDAGVCYEVHPFTASHEQMRPEVEVRGSNDVGDVTGEYRDPDWDGFMTIDSIMDYRYRHYPEDSPNAVGQTQYYAPYLNDQYRAEGWAFGTYGLYNWSHDDHSHMFFYENSRGEVSLAIRHDKMWESTNESSHDPYNGNWEGGSDGFLERSPGGGDVSWDIYNLPPGHWRYMDDMYIAGLDDYYTDANGVRYGHREAQYDSQPLRDFSGGDFFIDWTWNADDQRHGTDGGAYRGFDNLASSGPVTIDPEFVDGIEQWEVRHNDGTTHGEELELDMDSQLVIEAGANCLDGSLDANRNPVEAGQSVTLTAESGADEYRWDFDGDGGIDRNTSANRVSHTYNESGDVEVSVTMAQSGQTTEATTTLDVRADQPPNADFAVEDGAGDPNHHVAGEQLVFNGSVSSDNVALSGQYEWDVNGTAETGQQVAWSFSEPGDHEVTLTVTDRAGNVGNVTKTVTVVAQDDPEASASASPTEVEAGASVTLDGSESSDDHGSVVSYEWDAPGGSVDTPGQAVANVTYGSADEYNVTLTVTDNNDNTDTTTVPVTVTQTQAPNLTQTDVPDDVSAGGEFEVSADGNDNGRLATVVYTFSDGTTLTGEPGESVTHTFESAGTGTVTIEIRDEAGIGNETDPIPINVTQAPAADLTLTTNGTAPNGTETGENVTFDASGSDDSDGNIVEYQWDFDGDGGVDRTTNTSDVVTHAYDSGDTYDAAVTVVDNSGLTDTATAQIEVEGDSGDGDDNRAIGGGGGGSTNVGPPPVNKETEQTGPNSAAIDVRNARGDETIQSDLPGTEIGDQTGVNFRSLAVDLAADNPHVAFETTASAERPDGVAELSAPHETLAYLEVEGRYLGTGVENATVEFEVEESAIGGVAEPDDVVVYRYDDGAWTEVNATVVESEGDAYRLAATTDDLGTLAVGTNQPLAVSDAGLETETVATGETLTANVTVENQGETAEMGTVELALDGNVVAAETVEVPAGETAEVTLRGTAPATGTYEATVGGVSLGELEVLETRPADVSVADVSVNESTIAAGEQVAITATVENTGGEAGEQTVVLTLFGEELENETVRVDGGEKREVTFVRQIDAPGTYTAEVNGETVDVEVTESEDDGLGDAPPDVPGFGFGAALVALLAAALLARLRN